MSYQTIRYEIEAGVARLTLNRPQVRNGLNEQMTLELLDATRTAAADPAVKALLLTGAGTVFCSGGDLGAVNADKDPERRAEQGRAALWFMRDAVTPLVTALYHLDKPMITAINGPVVGGGIGLALTADIVVAAESARFMTKFTPLMALTPDLGYTWMMPRLIGRARTLGLSMLDENLSARQAEAWGLIWRCYPDAELPAAAAALAAKLARGPAFAMASLKTAMRESVGNDYDQQLRLEMKLSSQCCASEDYAEAVAAFTAKRSPVFCPVPPAHSGLQRFRKRQVSTDSTEVLLVGTATDGVLPLQIHRPEVRNALSSRVFASLRVALRTASADPAVRVVLLSGSGSNFAAGSDIRELAAHTAVSIQLDEPETIWQEITAFPKPIIGAVAGYCFGGGCELAMHCDILIASISARFAQPEINLGLMPGAGGTQRLPRAAGKSLAMQMALTGEPIDAQRALLAGLISEVVEEEEQLLPRAMQIARIIAAKGPIAVRYTKQAVLGAFNQSLRDGLLLERSYFSLLFSTADKAEGLAAFQQKRTPEFTGE